MMILRFVVFSLALVTGLALQSQAWAQALKVVETGPAAHAVLTGPSDGFFVRFDQPIDHVHSLLSVKRGDRVVENLQPRLQSAPAVLFARAPSLPPGSYTLHWSVKTLRGSDVTEGEVPFSVAGKGG